MSIGEIITWPFAWLLLHFYEWFGNYGVAIILFTLVIKLILLPFQMRSKRSTMRSARLTPLVKDLEKKYADDKQKYQMEVNKLYKQEGVNPMSGCLWTLIPFPILLLLYRVFRQPLTTLMGVSESALETITATIESLGYTVPTGTYAEISMVNIINENPGVFEGISDKLIHLDLNFLGLNLGAVPNWRIWSFDWSDPSLWLPALGLFMIPLISAASSYISMKVSMAGNPAAAAQQGSMRGMNLITPLISLYFCFVMPGAIGIYWISNSVFGMIQDVILNRYYGKQLDAEDAERRERIAAQEAELEQKRLETERKRALGETERNKNTSKKKLQIAEKNKNTERLAKGRAAEKAARRVALGLTDETPESQVDNRRYARGRAYVSDRYENPEGAEEATKNAAASSEIDEQVDREYDAMEADEAVENEDKSE